MREKTRTHARIKEKSGAVLDLRSGGALDRNPEVAHPLAFGKRTPKARFNLLMMAPLGIAFPDSYSLMTEPFSEIAVASCAWFSFFAVRACCNASLKSCDTVACLKVSPFSSNFAALGTCEWADLLPPAFIFLSVSPC